MYLEVGQEAPQFYSLDQNGNTISLQDFLGKKIALYFYPKDSTPGCTVQACNLEKNIELLLSKGIHVVGVSIDSQTKHAAFATKYNLNFPLVVDTDKIIVNKYKVWGKKKFMGKEYMGSSRITYLINENGIIDHVIEKVKTMNHAQQILDLWTM